MNINLEVIMWYKKFILLIVSFFFLYSCELHTVDEQKEIEFAPDQNSNSHPENTEFRDGVPVLSMPGKKIDEEKVDQVLKDANTSFSEIVTVREKEGIEKNIEKLKMLSQKKSIKKDKELIFSIYNFLGNRYLSLFRHTEDQDDLDQALKYAQSALSIFGNQPEYKIDLIPSYRILNTVNYKKGLYDKLMAGEKKLVEKYQDSKVGPFENWLPSNSLQTIYNIAKGNSQIKEISNRKNEKTIKYLEEVSDRYKNETGVTAQVLLVHHYFEQNELDKVKDLSKSIERRLKSLQNTAFTSKKRKDLSIIKKHIDKAEDGTN